VPVQKITKRTVDSVNATAGAKLLRDTEVKGFMLTVSSAVVTFYGSMKDASTENSPLELLQRKDAFRLAEAFDKITSQRTRNSIVALVQELSEPD
jgi:hypothetical protein